MSDGRDRGGVGRLIDAYANLNESWRRLLTLFAILALVCCVCGIVGWLVTAA